MKQESVRFCQVDVHQEDREMSSAVAELEQVTAELRGAERVNLEAMRFLDERGLLLEFRARMEQLDQAAGH